jgi:hypothetical protein
VIGKHATEEKQRIALDGTILRCQIGSGVHGTAVSGTDDRDEMGICIEPPEYVIGLTLPMPGIQRQFVREIRAGDVPMTETLDVAENLEARLRGLIDTSPLRAEPDREAADAWLISAYQRAWKGEA